MTEYKLRTGEDEVSIKFPQGYHDLTYGQFLRLRLEYAGDIGNLLDILTGVPRAIWMKMPVGEYDKVTKFLQWAIKSPIKWDELVTPKTLKIGEKEYPIPTDLGLESFGQKIILESKVTTVISAMMKPAVKVANIKTAKDVQVAASRKAQSSLISFIPFCVAVYMQPRISGKPFDETEVTALEAQILNSRAVEVYPIGNFFIRTLLGSVKPGITHSAKVKANLKAASFRKKQVSKKSKKTRGTS